MPVIIAVIVVLLIWFFSTYQISTEIVSGFIGVLIGGLISGGFQYWVMHTNQSHQLRMAALDRRLEIHQHAYTLWRKLLFADRKSRQIDEVIMECQDWWEKNCLFLSAEAREAFRRAYMSAGDLADFLRIEERTPDILRQIREINAEVDAAGPIIVSAVSLPAFGDEERRINRG